MNMIINHTAWMDEAPGMADIRPVEHKSSQISAGPQYVADVLGRFGAESTDTRDAAPAVLGYN
ncbi:MULTISPECIES: hypothetical protein [unclassified Burkholderia]|uniref:hypothetical protein n=1 Tax=unclassified Burkholderia TaxID=2613784 RepID=UPI000F5B1F67|nr:MULTISPECIES: hypothetical protein [unclassified Burkholderia]RQR33518.1 hypothetical protein DIE20_30245 [Burkholderia sp. Bp9131]RQR65055.1 hypothetical protein DIE12_32415 [Burkholderia sp. Bp9015]RQR90642.1 hypothetical protein DIE04_28005 [Burkholderia sp. Bp8994]RQS19908.1 hypothetical protein DIE05_34000 [Burkholderia sp. Bp8995]RQS32101.1 hypothetical protein DIE01_32005 [Burkholderia sp. Bp8990]